MKERERLNGCNVSIFIEEDFLYVEDIPFGKITSDKKLAIKSKGIKKDIAFGCCHHSIVRKDKLMLVDEQWYFHEYNKDFISSRIISFQPTDSFEYAFSKKHLDSSLEGEFEASILLL